MASARSARDCIRSAMRILPTYSAAITSALATTMITPAKLGSGRGSHPARLATECRAT